MTHNVIYGLWLYGRLCRGRGLYIYTSIACAKHQKVYGEGKYLTSL